MECVLSGKLLAVEEDGEQLPTDHSNGANCVHRPKMNPSSLGLKRNNFLFFCFYLLGYVPSYGHPCRGLRQLALSHYLEGHRR